MSGDTGNIPGLDSILRGEILRKDALINQLHNQNKVVNKATWLTAWMLYWLNGYEFKDRFHC